LLIAAVTPEAYTLIGLTVLLAGLIAILVFAVLRVAAAARDSRRQLRDSGTETALLSAALQEAVGKLKAQERAMAARAEASERLSGQIVSSLTAGVIVVGLDGTVRIANPSARRLLGLAQSPIPAPYRELLRDAPPLVSVIDECQSSGAPIVRRTLALVSPPGPATHLGVTASPLLEEGGEPGGTICLFTDLTAVVDLEDQLRLKDALARLGELTAGLAHEFRNGLATIHGYARLFDLDSLPEKQRPYLTGIRHETDALGEVVTNFLAFAKPATLTLTPVNLRSIAERAADDVRADVEARQGNVIVNGDFATIDGDEVLLRQALSNLARNACEACAEAGVPPQIAIAGAIDGRSQRITVSDNGPGIDPAQRERIFRPFVTTKREGTGLGLALVQKIIVTHNGRVHVADAPGGGTVFHVVLPLGRE
jgi:two-component system, NtrC family, sensor histidine kinase PilS